MEDKWEFPHYVGNVGLDPCSFGVASIFHDSVLTMPKPNCKPQIRTPNLEFTAKLLQVHKGM